MRPRASHRWLLWMLLAGGLLHCVGDEPPVPSGLESRSDATLPEAGPVPALEDSGDAQDAQTVSDTGASPADLASPPLNDGSAPPEAGPAQEAAPADGSEAGPASGCVSGGLCAPAPCATGTMVCTDAGETMCAPHGTSTNGSPCDGGVCYNGSCAPCSPGADCSEAGSCMQASISCATGVPVCVAQGALNGTSCGTKLYCSDGGCAPCSDGAACSPAANPCHVGAISCSGGVAMCKDMGTVANDGTACGTKLVCSGGQCVACAGGTACSPPDNPCKNGTTSCSTGSSVCTGLSNATDGTPCGVNQVCSGGNCVACSAGASCQPGGNPCLTGVVSCNTGSAVCTHTGQQTDGTGCGANQVCSSGQCGACSAGQKCNPNGSVCQTGMTSCSTGKTSCVGAANVPDGTSCGTNLVCFQGTCSACTAGTPCTPGNPPNACQTGMTSCASGQQTCAATGNAGNGTSCGTNQVCYGGTCVGCTSGTSCTPGNPPNACQTGMTSCASGQQACAVTGNTGNGTSCGTNQVCYGGTCVGCTSGTSCTPGNPPNPCQTGMTACTTGQPTCNPTGNVGNGTSCGTNQVCYGGTCVGCTSGTSCTPGNPPNPCQTGMTSCTSGQSMCNPTGNVTNATSCGSSSLCCAGVCAACSTTTNATDSCLGTTCKVTCTAGYASCRGLCVDTTSDSNACGAACNVCTGGATCVNSFCTAEYGHPKAFTPCNTASMVQNFTAGFLLGQEVTISTSITVTSLGVIGNMGGGNGILVLYSDSGGAPSVPQAQTASTPIAAGSNTLPVTNPVTVSPGNYWIMGEYDVGSSICVDSSSTNQIDYRSIPTYGTVPNPFGTPQTISGVDVNYYVVGVE